MIVTSIENGHLNMDDTISVDYSAFSIPFLRDVRIPCILVLSKRKDRNYLLRQKPLLLFQDLPQTTTLSSSNALLQLQHSPYYEEKSKNS